MHSLAFRPDGKVIATSGITRAFVVDAETGQELK
jgi:hypothetical protein